MTRNDTVPNRASHRAAARRSLRRLTAWAALAVGLAGAPVAVAQDDINPLGTVAYVPNEPLQELLKARRPKGPIFLSIPRAFAITPAGPGAKIACVPQILATNASNETLGLLMVGIRYRKPDGKEAGSTLSRFDFVKIGKEEINRFANPLAADACTGITGSVEVIRCTYDTGDSCLHDVTAIGFGAIPLKIKDWN
ncbi:hypothetical protein C5O80_05690 [Burkholderia sp. SRS-46]|nr:hypothetical protein C5O80_05690 [Burkholderia sp. SRS-46]